MLNARPAKAELYSRLSRPDPSIRTPSISKILVGDKRQVEERDRVGIRRRLRTWSG